LDRQVVGSCSLFDKIEFGRIAGHYLVNPGLFNLRFKIIDVVLERCPLFGQRIRLVASRLDKAKPPNGRKRSQEKHDHDRRPP
jgi:hypothetical protein